MSHTIEHGDAGLPFRPESGEQFKEVAKNLAWFLNLPLQAAQECLSRIYGYGDLHELQQILQTPGTANPDNLAWKRRQLRAERCKQIVNDFMAQYPLVYRYFGGRAELLAKIDLFDSPENLRYTFQLLKRRLGRKKGGDTDPTPALRAWLDEQFSTTLELDASPLVALDSYRPVQFAGEVADPNIMLKNQRAFIEPLACYLTAPVITNPRAELPGDAEINCWIEYGEVPDLFGENFEHFFNEIFYEDVYSRLLPEYLGDRYETVMQDLDETDSADEKYLDLIPRGNELREQYKLALRHQLSGAFRDHFIPREVLYGETYFRGNELDAIGESLHVFIELSPSDGVPSDEIRDMWLYRYCASFWVGRKGIKTLEPIGIMRGYYIVPFKGKYRVGPGNFQYFMDADSAMLNDVWKVLQYEYFPSQGMSAIDDYCDQTDFKAIATAYIELLPQYRGHRLSPHLLKLFSDTFEEYPYSAWSHTSLAPHADDDFDDFGDITEDYVNTLGIDLVAPGVFVLPVEGTQPEEKIVTPLNFLLTTSPAKVTVAKKDQKVERERDSLNRYFHSIQDQIDQSIVTYNPWDYPIT